MTEPEDIYEARKCPTCGIYINGKLKTDRYRLEWKCWNCGTITFKWIRKFEKEV